MFHSYLIFKVKIADFSHTCGSILPQMSYYDKSMKGVILSKISKFYNKRFLGQLSWYSFLVI